MRLGGGKAKGSNFERTICVRFSLWVSGGKLRDLFWRSSMSGGRATIIRTKGESNRQGGDICSVAPEGHTLTDRFFMECKHVKDIRLETFILANRGPIAEWWKKACKQAKESDRQPVLIIKGNHCPIITISKPGGLFGRQPVALCRGLAIGLLERTLARSFEEANGG